MRLGFAQGERCEADNAQLEALPPDGVDLTLFIKLQVISTGRRNTGGQLPMNNDEGLPNARPIAFNVSLHNQLSHNVIFSAAQAPPRNL